jgi:hypothetical protein
MLATRPATDGGESHVGSVVSGAEAHEAHGNSHVGRIEDLPAVTQVNLKVILEVQRAERRVGAGTLVSTAREC